MATSEVDYNCEHDNIEDTSEEESEEGSEQLEEKGVQKGSMWDLKTGKCIAKCVACI